MKNKNRTRIKAGVLYSLLIAGLVVSISAMMVLYNVTDTVEIKIVKEEKQWLTVGEGPLNQGFQYFMIYPHDATPDTTYATNLSNATAYEFSDLTNESAGSDVPYDTTFDLVWKCAYTYAQAYDTGDSKWNMTWLRSLVTSADLSIGADTQATRVSIVNDSGETYCYVHYYMNNAGAGYTTTHGEEVNVTSVKQQFYG